MLVKVLLQVRSPSLNRVQNKWHLNTESKLRDLQ